MTGDKQDWLDTAAAADLMSVARETVLRWIRTGRVQARRKGRAYVVERDALLALRAKPVAATALKKLRRQVEQARAATAKVEKRIGDVRGERDRIDQQREVLLQQAEVIQEERWGGGDAQKEAAEEKPVELNASIAKLEAEGRGLGATVEEFELVTLDLIGFGQGARQHHPDLSYTELELKRARLARWLAGIKPDGPPPQGIGLMRKLAVKLQKASEVLAEAMREYGAALALNAEARLIRAEQEVEAAEAELTQIHESSADQLLAKE